MTRGQGAMAPSSGPLVLGMSPSSRILPAEVGGLGLSREWPLVRVGVRVWVNQSEHVGGSAPEAHRIKHHHVHQELSDPGARGTKRSASVLPSLTTSRISSKTQSHAVHHGGKLHGYYEGDNYLC